MTDVSSLLPTADGHQTWRWVRRLVGGHRWLTFLAALAVVLATLAALAAPALFGRIVDIVSDGRPVSDLHATVITLVVVSIAAGALRALSIGLIARLTETALAEVRCSVVERALDLPLDQLERAGRGDVVSRVGDDVEAVSEAARQGFPLFIMSGLTVALTVAAMATLDWCLGLAALVAVPIQASALRSYLPRSRPLYAEERIANGQQAQHQLAAIGAAATVRDLGRSGAFITTAAAHADRLRALAIRLNLMQTRFFGRLNVAELAGTASVLTVGFLLVQADTITIGAATAAALYFVGLFDPINALLFLADEIQAAAAAMNRLVGIAQLPAAVPPAEPLEPRGASVDLEGVSFAYTEDHVVLHGIDLDISNGEHVAIVGASGAGKSTIAKLIANIHSPTTGVVRIGGVPSGELTVDGHVALINQPHVFGGPLADDLRLVRPDATDEELHDALRVVGADSWVSALSEGLDTMIGDHGRQLSATESQQLALARLVLAAPAVAVLDEATAEAGSAGARMLEDAARRATSGRTAVVIAHRLTQARDADRVVVLDHGRIVEVGTHDQLRGRGGHYATLWSAWASDRPDTGGVTT